MIFLSCQCDSGNEFRIIVNHFLKQFSCDGDYHMENQMHLSHMKQWGIHTGIHTWYVSHSSSCYSSRTTKRPRNFSDKSKEKYSYQGRLSEFLVWKYEG